MPHGLQQHRDNSTTGTTAVQGQQQCKDNISTGTTSALGKQQHRDNSNTGTKAAQEKPQQHIDNNGTWTTAAQDNSNAKIIAAQREPSCKNRCSLLFILCMINNLPPSVGFSGLPRSAEWFAWLAGGLCTPRPGP